MVVLGERFWNKTIEVNGPCQTPCRLWTGATVTNRSGMARGRTWHNGKAVLAHRLSCAAREGISLEEIEGLVVLHGCDNPLCVEHVSSGTQVENMADMVSKGRAGWQRKEAVA